MSIRLSYLNLITSGSFTLLGAAALYGGIQYGFTREDGQIGLGFLPALCGAAILTLGFIAFIRQIRHRQAPSGASPGEEETEDNLSALANDSAGSVAPDEDIFGRNQRTRNRQLAIVAFALVFAVVAVPAFGLLLSLAVLMLFISVFVERHRFLNSLLITALTIGVFYLAFVVLLGVPLPRGFLEWL